MKPGSKVRWSWGSGIATGVIKAVHPRKVTRKLKGNETTRNGTKANPALTIEQEDGAMVLKLSSEVEAA